MDYISELKNLNHIYFFGCINITDDVSKKYGSDDRKIKIECCAEKFEKLMLDFNIRL